MPPRKTQEKHLASRNSNEEGSTPQLDWGGWIDIQVTQDMKEQFDIWARERQDLMSSGVADVVGTGLKLTLSYDTGHNTFVASLNGEGNSRVHKRFTLTARSSDWWEAVCLLLYKHGILLKGDWANYKPKERYDITWG